MRTITKPEISGDHCPKTPKAKYSQDLHRRILLTAYAQIAVCVIVAGHAMYQPADQAFAPQVLLYLQTFWLIVFSLSAVPSIWPVLFTIFLGAAMLLPQTASSAAISVFTGPIAIIAAELMLAAILFRIYHDPATGSRPGQGMPEQISMRRSLRGKRSPQSDARTAIFGN